MASDKNGKGGKGDGPGPHDEAHGGKPHPHDHDHAHEPHPHDHAHEPRAPEAHPHEPHGHSHAHSHEPHPHAPHPARHGPHLHDHAQPRPDQARGKTSLKAAGEYEPADPAGVPAEHKARGPRWARVWVITCSDSRTEATDDGGRWIRARLADLGHVLSGFGIVKDEPLLIAAELDKAAAAGAQAVLITGGTGLSRRDSTFETISAQLVRPLPGFGELFRSLSYGEIGAAAMLSRAVAGVRHDGLLVFAMPGSPAAVRLACEKLIFPELTHLLEELAR